MQMLQKLVCFILAAILVSLTFLPFVRSSQQQAETNIIHTNNNNKIHEVMNPKRSSEIAVHGFLFWVSMGFLMPVGILAMRMSKSEENARRLKLIFYTHATLQIISVILATTGAILSLRNFENSFNNIHQRMGLALYIVIWLQALTGIVRPQWGKKGRSIWYLAHWLLGSAVSLLGIINMYTGLQAYQKRTSRSSRVWTILFTIEISFIVFLYQLQEKWDYIETRGMSLGNEPIQPTDQDSSPGEKQKETSSEPC